MSKHNNPDPLAGALRALRGDDYNNAAAEVSHALNLENNNKLDIFRLKVLLIRAATEHWPGVKEVDTVLVALGLLDGYYYDANCIENFIPSEAKDIGDRRLKYLQCGPYVRIKKRARYEAFDDIQTEEEKIKVRNSLGQQDGRLLDKLADYIKKIKNIKEYIDDAIYDPRFKYVKISTTKSGEKICTIQLPKQCLFLEDFPIPQEQVNNAVASENVDIPQDFDKIDSLSEVAPCVLSDDSAFSEVSLVHQADVIIPPVEEIFPTGKEIILTPGEKFELKVAVLPSEAANAPLSYVSLDTNIVTVSTAGILLARNVLPQREMSKLKPAIGSEKNESISNCATEIIIQAESGVSVRKKVTVNFSNSVVTDLPSEDIESFEPDFVVNQIVRLAGDKEWTDTLESVELGDKVEFQIQYKNQSKDSDHMNVVMKDILPKNLRYVAGTTKIFNNDHKNGLIVDQDTIAVNGLNIGNYGPGANAYVRFTAEVVDNSLACGANTLVNWAQCGVGQVTLQDYVILGLNKE